MKTTMRAVGNDHPCPVCGKEHKCSVGKDGLIMCGRCEGEVPGFVSMGAAKGDPQYHLYRCQGDPLLKASGNGKHAAGNGVTVDSFSKAREYHKDLTPQLRNELAAALGLPVGALEMLLIGWSARDAAWTFPETDGAGNVVGILRRYRDAMKTAMPGSRRGLQVPDSWRDRPGPVFIVEGPSDVLALTAVGLAAVGRPSNRGGVEHLTQLLRDFRGAAKIVVVGEHDANDHGDWPGREGAIAVASNLSAALGRPVSWVLPSGRAKDARAWITSRDVDLTDKDTTLKLGQKLAEDLTTGSKSVTASSQDDAKPIPYRFEALDSRTFFSTKYPLEWLVQRMLVAHMAGVLGGPKKVLKTSIAIDLAVSLASGTPFLGRFAVYHRHRVVIISGESGEAVLQETGRRICAARGIDPCLLDLHWSFDLRQIANVLDRRELRCGLEELEASVMILDPLYLALLAGADAEEIEAGNLFHIGPLLREMGRAALDVGCTPLLCHHAKKNAASDLQPLDLDDLSFAGIAEYARQWMLINRRDAFDPETGSHKLWLGAGGSAGQSGCWAVDVEEGVLDEHFGGRKWQVSVQTRTEANENGQDRKEREKKDRQARQVKEDGAAVLGAIDALADDQGGAVYSQVRGYVHLSGDRMTRAVLALKAERWVVEVPGEVRTGAGLKVLRTVNGLSRVSGLSGQRRDCPDSPDSDPDRD